MTFWEHKIFLIISSFRVDKFSTPLFTNPNVSLFHDGILAYNSSSSQPIVSLDESPPAVEPIDSSFVVHSSSFVPTPPPFRHSSRVS